VVVRGSYLHGPKEFVYNSPETTYPLTFSPKQ
jgi:hypothetical protein